AASDLSDGFAGDLAHVCEASGVGAEVTASSWPHDAMLERAAHTLGCDIETLRFGPSDDYELLLAIDPAHRAAAEAIAREAGIDLTIVGRFTEMARAIVALNSSGESRTLGLAGFDHFR